MRILLTGSGGLIGRALVPTLTAGGHEVTRLTRSRAPTATGQISWNPSSGTISAESLEGFDAVVHLAGESVAGRWTSRKKARILESRAKGTRLLSESLAQLRHPPGVLVSASAVGFYGDRGDEIVNEASPAGSLFLSEVATAWEAATEPAARRGIRVVNLRIGFVLSAAGGGLAMMLLPFKLGVGGRVVNGRQYLSWVALDDVLGAVLHVLTSDALRGPVNVVAPHPVTNLEFTKTLGRVLRRPTIFPMPAFAARLAFGEMADNLLLASTRAVPSRLLATGYQFRFPQLEAALRHVLGETRQLSSR
ncbi:MAG: TIGR01777 family oxidoreductase [Acidobacteriia bacterium]|nr:TIGR01777 family oxidoreductase [Terriglobia bacterium]